MPYNFFCLNYLGLVVPLAPRTRIVYVSLIEWDRQKRELDTTLSVVVPHRSGISSWMAFACVAPQLQYDNHSIADREFQSIEVLEQVLLEQMEFNTSSNVTSPPVIVEVKKLLCRTNVSHSAADLPPVMNAIILYDRRSSFSGRKIRYWEISSATSTLLPLNSNINNSHSKASTQPIPRTSRKERGHTNRPRPLNLANIWSSWTRLRTRRKPGQPIIWNVTKKLMENFCLKIMTSSDVGSLPKRIERWW